MSVPEPDPTSSGPSSSPRPISSSVPATSASALLRSSSDLLVFRVSEYPTAPQRRQWLGLGVGDAHEGQTEPERLS